MRNDASSVAVTDSIGLERVLDLVRNTAGGAVDADAPLMDAGVDSLGAVELRTQLQAAVGDSQFLSSTVVFDHPTARQLALMFEKNASPPVFVANARLRLGSIDGSVRLACVSAMLPGGARGLLGAWNLAATGRGVFTVSPAVRWDTDAPKSIGLSEDLQCGFRYGSFLDGVQLFDNSIFRISLSETETMDPQQRLLLELGYGSLHGASLPRLKLAESNTAVFVGVMSVEFREALQHTNAFAMTGTGHCFAAGRLSYVLALHGASEAIDVACSSALVACHHARRTLQLQDSHVALLAGVNMMFRLATLDGYAAAGLTSPLGRPFVFDARARRLRPGRRL